ncbi:MAG: polyprenyl synthetase family protein [Clostridium celatum]|nr:polyprenyl synthetase family protein [Clostridium celatum]
MHKLWNKYPEVNNELKKVKELIEKNAKCRDKIVEESIIELLNSGGKMLRPAFVILSSKFGEYEEKKSRALASVVEMFHMATLVHDDIIDEATLRRGKETVQSKYGKNYAVYIGDYLFCICFKVLAGVGSLDSVQIDTMTMSRICMSEIDQLNSRFDKNVSVKKYLKRASGKTAELFSLSLYLGAAESGCSRKLSRAFWEIGHNIGMAFQIIDDILDYTGSDESIGKNSANDLKQGIYTLPLILALENKPSELVNILGKSDYTENDVVEIIKLVNKYDGVKKAREIAKKYTNKAYKQIKNLPENEYREVLLDITKSLLDRIY